MALHLARASDGAALVVATVPKLDRSHGKVVGPLRDFAPVRDTATPLVFAPRSKHVSVIINSRNQVQLVGKTRHIVAGQTVPHCPTTEWIDIVSTGATVPVVVAELPESTPASELVRALQIGAVAVCGRVPVIDLRSSAEDHPYLLVGEDGAIHNEVPEGACVWADGDVLVDLKKTAQGRYPDGAERIADLVSSLRRADFRPGLAIAQHAWNRDQLTENPIIRGEFAAAVDAWFDQPFANLGDPRRIKHAYERAAKKHAQLTARFNSDNRPDLVMLMSYVCLLKTAELWLPHIDSSIPPSQRVEIYSRLVDYLNQDGIGVSARALAVSRAALLGKPGRGHANAVSFTKMEKGVDAIYGQAWDLAYLCFLDGMGEADERESGGGGNGRYLLTRDHGLAAIQSYAKPLPGVSVSFPGDDYGVPIIVSDIDPLRNISEKQLQEAGRLSALVETGHHSRKARSQTASLQSLVAHTKDLELRVGELHSQLLERRRSR